MLRGLACRVAGLVLLLLFGWPGRAFAQCMQSVAALSEARSARWLIADDAKLQAMTDLERARVTGAVRDLGGAPQAFHVFAGATGMGQMLFGMPTCTNQRELEGRVERLRLAGNAGFTHAATGLHVRLSFVRAVDRLVVDVRQAGDKAGEVEIGDANAGYTQDLFALRFGHERWLQAMVGYVGADRPFDSPSRDGLRLDARLSGRPAPGYFVGATVPALRTSVFTYMQRRQAEVVSLMVGELQPGSLPFSVALGPTYLHEERQVVGLVRLRAIAHSSYVLRRNQTSAWVNDKSQRVNADHASSFGPTLELSTESRDMRLRHARMRWDYRVMERYVGRTRGQRGVASLALLAEASVFRSRAFLDSLRPGDPDDTALARVPTGSRRATAWGFGGGASGMLQLGPGTLGLDLHAGVNRPDLLALMPSAAQHFELQGLITARVEY